MEGRTNFVLIGDAREKLSLLTSGSIHCCVTSPPYWQMRDYGVDGQLGSEGTPMEYVENMVGVFSDVRRVLRDDGTLWLNLGDTYHNKRLVGIPWLVALALQECGWYLRSDIVWSKPNPLPESIKDRPTRSHEYVFLMAKSPDYFYDSEAVKEDMVASEVRRRLREAQRGHSRQYALKVDAASIGQPKFSGSSVAKSVEARQRLAATGKRNRRSVWTITKKPFAGAHFATFPIEIPTLAIKAGTSERGCCSRCGRQMKRIVIKGSPNIDHQIACGASADGGYAGVATKNYGAAKAQNASDVKRRILAGMVNVEYEWIPSCECRADTTPSVVLDPFAGAGTTLLAAKRLGRDYIGCEINESYVNNIIKPRLAKEGYGTEW